MLPKRRHVSRAQLGAIKNSQFGTKFCRLGKGLGT